jgi:hypothetical protein
LRHYNKALYAKECSTSYGMLQNPQTETLAVTAVDGTPPPPRVSYESFVAFSYKWHIQMARAFMNCLEGKEYLEIRNTMVGRCRLTV